MDSGILRAAGVVLGNPLEIEFDLSLTPLDVVLPLTSVGTSVTSINRGGFDLPGELDALLPQNVDRDAIRLTLA